MITRRRLLKGLLGTFLAGLFAVTYGFWIEPALRLRVQKWKLKPKDWPEARRLRIAVLADFHMGEPIMTLERLKRIVTRTNALGADLIVLLGDYPASFRFVKKPVPLADVAGVLAELQAPLGVFAILGNHDWWADRAAQRRRDGPCKAGEALASAGLRVLENEAVAVGEGDEKLWLAGLGDQLAFIDDGTRYTGRDDLAGTLAQVTDDAPVVLLAHEPDIFPQVPARVALTLSGHTHGGQVRLFGWSPVVPSRFGNRYAYGHVREGGRDLVVSGGLGCSILPVRFGVVPEITLIELG